jgi:hypothetical protein
MLPTAGPLFHYPSKNLGERWVVREKRREVVAAE